MDNLKFFNKGISTPVGIIIIVLCALITGGILAYQYWWVPKEEIKEVEELTLDAIKNAEYYYSECETLIRLKDGSFEERNYSCGGDILLGFRSEIYNDKVAFGDLNNDGKKDAAVVLTTNYGGSGNFRELAVIINQNGKPHHLTSQDLGDRVIINSLVIEVGIVSVDMITHGLKDPMCCPTQREIVKYKLSGDKLEIVIDKTANWKTYRNEEYGCEVKYPDDWFVRKDAFTKEIYFGEKGEVMGAEGEKITVEKVGFSIGFYSNVKELWGNEEGLSLKDWLSKTFLPLTEEETMESITFGIDNYKGFLVKKYKEVGVIELITRAYVQKNASIYELKGEVPTIATVGFPTKYDYEKIFNQMLSTFRFLE